MSFNVAPHGPRAIINARMVLASSSALIFSPVILSKIHQTNTDTVKIMTTVDETGCEFIIPIKFIKSEEIKKKYDVISNSNELKLNRKFDFFRFDDNKNNQISKKLIRT